MPEQNNGWDYTKWYDLTLGTFAAAMVVLPKWIALPIIVLAILTVIGVLRKQLTFKNSFIGFGFVTLYALYGLYCIWTNHPVDAGKYMEYKMTFFILPLLLSFQHKQQHFYITIGFFQLAVLALLLFSFAKGIFCLWSGGDIHCFLSSVFSSLHHPTYFSAYLILALALLWYCHSQKWGAYKKKRIIGISILYIAGILCCLSLAGLLYFFAFLTIVIMYKIFKSWGKWAGFSAIALAPVLIWSMFVSIPYVEGEWTAARFYAVEYLKDPEHFVQNRQYPMSGSEIRITMWTAASMEVGEHPMGVGTANVDDHLSHRLTKWGLSDMAALHYNPHNQYLQTALEIGILGLLALLFVVIYGVYSGIKNRNWLLVVISTNLGFNCLFESMLQRQSGIVFYVLVMVLLDMYTKKNREEEPVHSVEV